MKRARNLRPIDFARDLMATNQDKELYTADHQKTPGATGDPTETDHGDHGSQNESQDGLETKSTASSRKLQNLRNRKKSAKGRLTKARNQLRDRPTRMARSQVRTPFVEP